MTITDNICLPKTYFITIFSIFIASVVWYIHFDKKKHLDEKDYKYNETIINKMIKTIDELKKTKITSKEIEAKISKNIEPTIAKAPLYFIDTKNSEMVKTFINDIAERKTYLKERDAKVLYDDLSPPERRLPEHQYPTATVKQMINIPTRGLPDDYQLLGIVLRDNTETVYNLFGRQTFPNSNQYEYYVQATMHNNTVKLPIRTRGDKEIMDNDDINIPGMDKNKGKFTVKLYKFDAPRYNPYL
jgi:hypothetical protein